MTPRPLGPRSAGIAAGYVLDLLFADPERGHPVAAFGSVAAALERLLLPEGAVPHARTRGVAYTLVLLGGATGLVAAADRALASRAVPRAALTALVTWTCLGGTSLLRVGARERELLDAGELDAARALLPWLCGRDPSVLDADGLARAVVESLAENTSDAAVATLLWAGLAGPAGAAAHRAANTLDAMVGHRSERHERFGWASARLDDVLGWPAARLAGLLTVTSAAPVGGDPAGAARAWARDARRHPSPNAGVVEAACAGALGVRLGGVTPYPYGVQRRPELGEGRAPVPADVDRAIRLERAVQHGAAALAVLGVLGADRARQRRSRRRSPRLVARRLSASKRSP